MAPSKAILVAAGVAGDNGISTGKNQIIRAVFPRFSESKSGLLSSPSLRSHGEDWKIDLYPSGRDEAAMYAYISAYVTCVSVATNNNQVSARFSLRIISDDRVYVKHSWKNHVFDIDAISNGVKDFCYRPMLLSAIPTPLVNGALLVEAEIALISKTAPIPRPNSTFKDGMLKCLTDATQTGDVVFYVEG